MKWNHTKSKWLYKNVQKYVSEDQSLIDHRKDVGLANKYVTQSNKLRYEAN